MKSGILYIAKKQRGEMKMSKCKILGIPIEVGNRESLFEKCKALAGKKPTEREDICHRPTKNQKKSPDFICFLQLSVHKPFITCCAFDEVSLIK